MIGTMSLSELAGQLDGKLLGADASFSSLSTDSRAIAAGDAYLALVGERFDGNDFVEQAAAAGASAAIVSRTNKLDLPQLLVADTHLALAQIARENRQRSRARVVALTGSQGKTTVKEMIAAILSRAAPTLSTLANLNNTIGVPLTLLRLEQEHRYAVIEMGANRKGEIAFSTTAARPDVAMITNASDAHIEGFGSLQGIVEAKGEILDGLEGQGVAVLNADDPNVDQWITRAGDNHVVLFSYENAGGGSSFYARKVSVAAEGGIAFELESPLGSVPVELNMLGKHNINNAVAAAAAAIEAGANLEQVRLGLADVRPVAGRMNPLPGVSGSQLIDDTYNASPSSFFAAIDVLTTFKRKKILVAGDMRELGPDSDEGHVAVGRYASAAGIDELWAVGKDSALTITGFGERGKLFSDQQQLIDACQAIASDQIVFLVKGSRGAKMDVVVTALHRQGDS